ncbi:hypothetical protein JCM6882_001841 [Rhodosporidiobolus microsporus]
MSANPQYQDKDASSTVIGGRPGVVYDAVERDLKNPPNNLDLADPREQDRAADLVGSQTTEAIDDTEQSAEEKARIQALADKLNA